MATRPPCPCRLKAIRARAAGRGMTYPSRIPGHVIDAYERHRGGSDWIATVFGPVEIRNGRAA